MKQVIASLLVVVLISGCATGYHRQGFTGGYTDIRLQDDIFKVGFRGNAYCGSGRSENFTLLRCAEITLENGYKYFVIVEDKSDMETSISGSDGGIHTYHKPGTSYTIKCFKDKPENIPAIVYNAEQIKNNIKAQYKLK